MATIRQARGIDEPDPVGAAYLAELAGAEGIVVHLREDRRHIQDRDVRILRDTVKTKLNLEMAATKEMVKIAKDIAPDMVTLVPEKREELTTEGGLDVFGNMERIKQVTEDLFTKGIPVSLFIDPDEKQVDASVEVGVEMVEIHTGTYAEAGSEKAKNFELKKIESAVKHAYGSGLRVGAGHGLDYFDTPAVAKIEHIEELNIGHGIISRAVLVGMETAVRDMVALCKQDSR